MLPYNREKCHAHPKTISPDSVEMKQITIMRRAFILFRLHISVPSVLFFSSSFSRPSSLSTPPPLYFPFLLHFFLPLCLFRPFLPRSSILSTPSISSFCIPFVSNEFLQRKIRLWHSFKKIFFSFSSLQCSIVNRFMLTQL